MLVRTGETPLFLSVWLARPYSVEQQDALDTQKRSGVEGTGVEKVGRLGGLEPLKAKTLRPLP